MAVSDEGPPEQPNYVRVKHIRGGWTLAPTSDGGSDVTYIIASHPGGTIPAWIINAAQKEGDAKFTEGDATACGENAKK